MSLQSAETAARRLTTGTVLPIISVTGILLLLAAHSAVPAQAANHCQFTLGFALLRDMVNEAEGLDVVGLCLEDTHHDANGNALQNTRNGLLAWANDTNWTGFTDGASTWVNGPNGLEKRPNGGQLAWEREAGGPEGPSFSMLRPRAPGSFVAVEDLGNGAFSYVVNGAPQVFIGMGYNPIYRYLSDDERAASYDRDFRSLCQAGVNHIIGWDADKGYEQDKFDEVTLDLAHQYGLGVIMPFYLPVEGDYQNADYRESLMDQAILKIRRFKDHPALRIWGVGNEVLSEMESSAQRAAFSQFYVRLIDLFHNEDPDHPVIYRGAEDLFVPFLRGFLNSPAVPRPWFIWGINAYTGRLNRILDEWSSHRTDGPVLVSEFGAEPDWPGGRAVGYTSMWRTIRSHSKHVLGGAPYTWTTQGPEPTDVKWGLMDGEGRPVDSTFDFLRTAWLQEGSRSCP